MLALDRIAIHPLADESLGVRSMALGIETSDVTVLFDAGVSLAPRRFGLPPHPEEFRAARAARNRILEFARKCDIIAISHYHLDHYTPSFVSFYEWSSWEIFEKTYGGRTLLVKKPDETVSFNQRRRAAALFRDLKEIGSKIVEADGLVLKCGSTIVKALGPYPHGEEGPLGHVLAFVVKSGSESVVYAPDVQGPISAKAASEIAAIKPSVLIIGGPPTYLGGSKVDRLSVERGLENLARLSTLTTVVVGHHLLRDQCWTEILKEFEVSRYYTYAALLGIKNTCLESMRRMLYSENPPDSTFLDWLEKYRRGERVPPPL